MSKKNSAFERERAKDGGQKKGPFAMFNKFMLYNYYKEIAFICCFAHFSLAHYIFSSHKVTRSSRGNSMIYFFLVF